MKPSAPYYTLDLHGYRKEDAIERLTRYFDQIRNPPVGSSANKHATNEVFATVITGSGKHSHDGQYCTVVIRMLCHFHWRTS
jgi:hypothetical protein